MNYPSGQGCYGQPGPYPTVHTQVLTQPYRSSTAHIVIAWIIAVLTAAYMLPWAIAATRNKSNTAVIALINLLLGWSLVGWIVALVMSVSSEPQPVLYVNTAVFPTRQPTYGPQVQQAPALPPGTPPGWAGQLPTYAPQTHARPGAESTAILPPYPSDPWQPPTDGSHYR